MKPTLDCHNITIVNKAVHDASFACVPQNKVSFSARGWNSMHRNVLCLPGVIGSMSNKDREEDAMASYIIRSGKSTIIYLKENTPNHDIKFAAPPVRKST